MHPNLRIRNKDCRYLRLWCSLCLSSIVQYFAVCMLYTSHSVANNVQRNFYKHLATASNAITYEKQSYYFFNYTVEFVISQKHGSMRRNTNGVSSCYERLILLQKSLTVYRVCEDGLVKCKIFSTYTIQITLNTHR